VSLYNSKWWYWIEGGKCASTMMFKTYVEWLKIMPVTLSTRIKIALITIVLEMCDFFLVLFRNRN